MVKNYKKTLLELKNYLISISDFNEKDLKKCLPVLESYLANIIGDDIKNYLIKLINEIESDKELTKIKLTLLILVTSIEKEL